MPSNDFSIRFWGVRGSVPVSGTEFARVGGSTACVEMRCGKHVLFFDAGSGLPAAGIALEAEGIRRFDLFLSHCHYDHIIGLPFFNPLFDRRVEVTIHSGHMRQAKATEHIVANLMKRPFFPVGPDIFEAHIEYADFAPGATLAPRRGISITTRKLNHPGGAVGYRVTYKGKSAAYVTDMEHEPGKIEPGLIDFVSGADLVIYDAAYTDAELKTYRGFGHSTWQQGVRLCRAAGAKRLALFHHSQHRDDKELEAIERAAKAEFSGAFLARQDMQVLLSSS
jgi:phosphoribosyl 1,2-cyclic phosphodiesterase